MGKHKGKHKPPEATPPPKQQKSAIIIFTPPPPDPNYKTQRKICKLLEEGMWKRDAAILSGIDESTFYDWIKAYPSFPSQVETSIIKYKQKLIKVVNSGSLFKPDIAVKVLEKRWPKEWNKPTQVEIVDPDKQLSETLSKLMGAAPTSKEAIMNDSDEPNPTESAGAIPGTDQKKSA